MPAVYKHIQETSGGVDSSGVRTYRVMYHVHTDDPDDQGLVVTDITFMPEAELYVSTYDVGNESDSTAVCVGVDADRMEGSLVDWRVTVTYSSKPLGEAQTAIDSGTGEPTLPSTPAEGNNLVPPSDRPWVIRWGSTKSTKLLTTDYTAPTPLDVVNSAGIPFDPPLQVEVSRVTLHVTLYQDGSFNFAKIRTYTNAVNEDSWMGFPLRTLRCTDYTATSQFDNGTYYWQIDLGFEYEPDGWNPVYILDAGCHGKISSTDDSIVNFVDKQGNPITSPVPLDGGGKRLATGNPLQYRQFQGYREEAFANIV